MLRAWRESVLAVFKSEHANRITNQIWAGGVYSRCDSASVRLTTNCKAYTSRESNCSIHGESNCSIRRLCLVSQSACVIKMVISQRREKMWWNSLQSKPVTSLFHCQHDSSAKRSISFQLINYICNWDSRNTWCSYGCPSHFHSEVSYQTINSEMTKTHATLYRS